VGNNIPVFFIQDAMKFPDLVHAVKPEPHNEIPQASAAHDTFWDFISLMPESMHMIMWAMSDRAIPRSYRMMEGFGVHTFRLVNAEGRSHFVKFHWKPLLGVHAVAWDEAQKLSGKDSDFHRRDLWEAIENGAFPEYELGLQIIPEEDEHKFEFDLLDPTKIVPEELVPVRRVGKMTLNRNPDNFFAETEQAAFHPGHLVPGIDFTNDPLLQGRVFSYLDTQLSRLGTPNFHEIPINRPIVPVTNNQRDGMMRQTVNRDKVSYEPNSIGGGCPFQAKMAAGGFTSYHERIDGRKIRERSPSFLDHFSQATLFYNSQSEAEKEHLTNALIFELGMVKREAIRARMVGLLTQVDAGLAARVAEKLGLPVPSEPEYPMNHSFPADADPARYQPVRVKQSIEKSAALSMENTVKDTVKSRMIAILAADGVDEGSLNAVKSALESAGASTKIIAPQAGRIVGAGGKEIKVDHSFMTTGSVLYDAVFVPAGAKSAQALANEADAVHFVSEAYRHCKAIAAAGEGVDLLRESYVGGMLSRAGKEAEVNVKELGVLIDVSPDDFIRAVAQHRFWKREKVRKVPA
jgi:catalase